MKGQSFKWQVLFMETITAVLVLLFVYTGVVKLNGRENFLSQLYMNPLLKGFQPLLSWLVPVTELMIGILLLVPATRKAGLLASALLLGCFTVYIVWMMIASPHLPCSCGGIISSLSWKAHLWLNISLTALSLLSYKWHPKNNLGEVRPL